MTAAVLTLAVCVATPARALLESCAVTATPTAFGSYNPVSATPLDTTGQITVTCTAILSIAVSYTISLSAGGSGSATARTLTGPSSVLPYNLYTDSGRSTIWGNGSGGTGTVSDGYTLGLLIVVRNYPVYGRIPAGASVRSGAYADTLVVTLNY